MRKSVIRGNGRLELTAPIVYKDSELWVSNLMKCNFVYELTMLAKKEFPEVGSKFVDDVELEDISEIGGFSVDLEHLLKHFDSVDQLVNLIEKWLDSLKHKDLPSEYMKGLPKAMNWAIFMLRNNGPELPGKTPSLSELPQRP